MDNRLKYSLGAVEMMGIALGVILLVVFSEYLKLNNIAVTNNEVFFVRCFILTFTAALYGPVAGGLIGVFSELCIGMINTLGFNYSAIIAYAVYGYYIGAFANKYGIREGKFETKNLANFNCTQMCANILVFGLFVPLAEVIFQHEILACALKNAIIITIYNIVINFTVMTVLFLLISKTINLLSKKIKKNLT